MRRKILKAIVVILLILSMTILNFILLGTNIAIAVANNLEEQEKTTSISNIEFDAYYKNNNQNVHAKELKTQSEETLYIQINVKDKVSVSNAKIKLENTNFQIIKEKVKESNYIQNIDSEKNEIIINAISSNNNMILELPIKFKKEENFKTNYFELENKVVLEGKYKNEKQEEQELKGEINLKTIYTENTEINITQKIEKYFGLGENGSVLQQKVITEIKDNNLPRSQERIEVEIPTLDNEKPEKIKVLLNGKEIEESKIQINNEAKNITINNKKEINTEEKTQWGNEKSEYTIIYKYNNKVQLIDRKIKLKVMSNTNVYSKNDSIQKVNEQEIDLQPQGSVATIKTNIIADISKGYIYANSSKEVNFEESNELEVSYKEGVNGLILDTNQENYINEKEQAKQVNNSIIYKSTVINKQELINIFGEEGNISIKNENKEELFKINKDSNTDEKGNINVLYTEGNDIITFETTAPIREGKLSIKNVKAIKGQTQYKQADLKTFKKVEITSNLSTNISKEISKSQLELKEPTTQIKTEINKSKLSTIKTNKEIEIKTILKSNSEQYDLYKNPIIEIEFPEDVKNVEVNNINVIYGEEFTIRPIKGNVNGKQVIRVQLLGEQTEYKEIGIEGTTIVINLNLELDKKATSKEGNITTRIINEKANGYKDGQSVGIEDTKVNIVSPKGLITTNNINTLDVETIGEEKIISKTLEKSTSAKQIKVNSEIINNNEEEIKDVKVIGTFGTNGKTTVNGEEKQNNVNEVLKSGLEIAGEDISKVKVYYSENVNATEDLNNIQNGWKENITDGSKAKKYLITVDNMKNSESLAVSYNAEIAENLEYNQQSYRGYSAKYTQVSTGTEQKVDSTTIELKTGAGPVLEAKLSASVGGEDITNGGEVKKGEIIKYNVLVKNTGNERVENVKIIATIAEGTVLLKEQDLSNLEGIVEKQIDIKSIETGENVIKSFYIKVKGDTKVGQEIRQKLTFKYDEVTKETNELLNFVSKVNDIRLEVKREEGHLSEYNPGDLTAFYLNITNNSDRELNNIIIDLEIPKEYSVGKQEVAHFEHEDNIKDEDVEFIKNEDKIIIKKIETNKTIHIKTSILINDSIEGKEKELMIWAKSNFNENIYRSNGLINKVVSWDNFKIQMTANNENEYLNVDDKIEYKIDIKNENIKEYELNFIDNIPMELTIEKIMVNEEEKSKEEVLQNGNKVQITRKSSADK